MAAVDKKDNKGNSDGGGHRQQSIKSGSRRNDGGSNNGGNRNRDCGINNNGDSNDNYADANANDSNKNNTPRMCLAANGHTVACYSIFLIWSNESFIIRTIYVYFVIEWEVSPSSPTLSSKTKEEPAVVALQVVVHEATSELNSAIEELK